MSDKEPSVADFIEQARGEPLLWWQRDLMDRLEADQHRGIEPVCYQITHRRLRIPREKP